MPNEKPLTKSSLISVLKEVGVATKDDVREIVGEEIVSRGVATKDDVREIVGEEIVSRGLATESGVQRIVAREISSRKVATKGDVQEMIEQATDAVLEGVNRMFLGQNERLAKIEADVSFIKQDVRGLKADLSNTVSRREFDVLKRKVNRRHSTV